MSTLDPNDPNYVPPEPDAPDPALDAANARIAELEAELAQKTEPVVTALAPPVVAATATIGAAPAVADAVDAADVQPAVHALAPGSAGPHVAELATLVEKAGETTYLTDGTQNPAHVFTNDLLAAIRRVLHAHPEIAAVVHEAERQRLNRWIGGLHVITGDVWQYIQDVADAKKAAT